MTKVRMSWEWVEGYPIYVYTKFLDHFVFEVRIMKGEKGTIDSSKTGPNSKHWKKYIEKGSASKDEVVFKALNFAKECLEEEEGLI